MNETLDCMTSEAALGRIHSGMLLDRRNPELSHLCPKDIGLEPIDGICESEGNAQTICGYCWKGCINRYYDNKEVPIDAD